MIAAGQTASPPTTPVQGPVERPVRVRDRSLHPALILGFVPLAILESPFARTWHMDFVPREPAQRGAV